MATLTATSRLKPIEKGKGALKYQLPYVLKKFVVGFVKDLTVDDRAAFRFMCLGDVPGSSLNENVEEDRNLYKLFESLVQIGKVSAMNVSYLKQRLLTIGRKDWLQRLEQVELRMFMDNIVEGYVRQDGGSLEGACCCDTAVDLIVEIKTRNMCLIEDIVNQLSTVDAADDGKDDDIVVGVFLRICNKIICSHRSWFGLVACLAIVELYVLHSRRLVTPDDVALGWQHVCAFSETKTSQLLAEWILENGGRKTFEKSIRELDSGSDIPEALREMRRLLQNYVEIKNCRAAGTRMTLGR